MTFNVHRWIGWFFSGCGPSFPERTVDAVAPTTERLRYGLDVYVPPREVVAKREAQERKDE